MLAIVEGFGRICGRQANQHADHGLTWAHVLHPWPPLPSAPASSRRTCRAPAALPARSGAPLSTVGGRQSICDRWLGLCAPSSPLPGSSVAARIGGFVIFPWIHFHCKFQYSQSDLSHAAMRVFCPQASHTTTRPQTLPTGGYLPSGAPSSFPKTVWG